jgi:DNA-binding response OmpR family regulator
MRAARVETPVLILSGLTAAAGEREGPRALGADDFITKPFDSRPGAARPHPGGGPPRRRASAQPTLIGRHRCQLNLDSHEVASLRTAR